MQSIRGTEQQHCLRERYGTEGIQSACRTPFAYGLKEKRPNWQVAPRGLPLGIGLNPVVNKQIAQESIQNADAH